MESTKNMTNKQAAYGYDVYLRYNGDLAIVQRLVGPLTDRMEQHYHALREDGRDK